jgi:hypothetical protein
MNTIYPLADSRRTLVVGDIHGSYDELLALVELAGIGERDTIVAVGDLVDRGPKSREVVEFFGADPARRRSVRGNHEAKHLRSRGGPILSKAGRIVRQQVSASQYAAMLDYFETLPLWLDLPEALIVHAGLTPGVALDQQDPKVVMGVGSSYRLGFDGKSPWWFDQPEFLIDKPVIFGHEKHPEGVVRGQRGNVYGLDTGAALGGSLTGLLLPEFRLISVPVPDYWTAQLQHWLPQLLKEDIRTQPWKTLLGLDPSDPALPAIVAEELTRVQAGFHRVVTEIERRREVQLQTSGYWDLPDPERRTQVERWRNEAVTELDRWVVESIPHREVRQLVQRKAPNWSSLQRVLSDE